MRFSSLLGFATFGAVLARPSALMGEKVDSPLQLQLSAIGNTRVKATLTNNGASTLRLLNKGTFLDSNPAEKVHVYAADTKIPFLGIHYNILRTDLPDDAFTTITAQESLDLEFDIAELHDLAIGGQYSVFAAGAIPYAAEGSNDLSGEAVAYSSNLLEMDVDGGLASNVLLAIETLERRTKLSTNECTATQLNATSNGLKNCAELALKAAAAASTGNVTKFNEYFKTTSDVTRKNVTARFEAVAAECNSTTSGKTTYSCKDTYSGCTQGNVLAYTVPRRNYIVNCPLFFSALPAISPRCHGQDQATTTLHEMTHAPDVFYPGTDDKGYGYAAASKLNAKSALENADTYALYTNAIHINC